MLWQHRVSWSHFRRHLGTPRKAPATRASRAGTDGAMREAAEEAGVPGCLDPRAPCERAGARLLELRDARSPMWSRLSSRRSATRRAASSRGCRWRKSTDKPLASGFASSWQVLRRSLEIQPAVIVDVANVMGWCPTAGGMTAPARPRGSIRRISALAVAGCPPGVIELPEHTWFPKWVAVVEGQARTAGATRSGRGGAGRGHPETTRSSPGGATSSRRAHRHGRHRATASCRGGPPVPALPSTARAGCSTSRRPGSQLARSAIPGRGAGRCRGGRAWSGGRRHGLDRHHRGQRSRAGEACDRRPTSATRAAPTRFEIG